MRRFGCDNFSRQAMEPCGHWFQSCPKGGGGMGSQVCLFLGGYQVFAQFGESMRWGNSNMLAVQGLGVFGGHPIQWLYRTCVHGV